MRTILSGGLLALACACGDGGAPECKQVISSCVNDCDISCDSAEEVACVGPDFGPYPIGESERCCICIDPNRNYAE